MKKIVFLIFAFFTLTSFSQETVNSIKFDKKEFLKEVSENACKCIDSVETFNKIVDSVSSDIHKCIDKQVIAYQLGIKIEDIKNIEDKDKKVTISINTNADSNEYKKYYYDIEKYLMQNCSSIKSKMAANDVLNEKSHSRNSEAIKYYNLGLDESDKENYSKAIEYYKKAVVFDSDFAFAYDNIGICYRKLNKFDEAIEAYEKSLKIDPNGKMPLQNIAIAYIYKKEYKKGLKAYEKLSKLDPNNPEVFYGIGNIYANYVFDYEKGLDNLCKAYNIYVKQKSPYRTDAETLINVIYKEMKKQGKEALFNQILENNNISPN